MKNYSISEAINYGKKAKDRVLGDFNMIELPGLENIESESYIVKRLGLTRGNLAMLCATGGSGKTFLAQYIAACVSTGKPLFGQFEVEKGLVVHVDQEQSPKQTLKRYQRIANSLKIKSLDVKRGTLDHRFDVESDLLEIKKDLIKLCTGATLVIIDSLKATTTADENSAAIEPILKILKSVAIETNCCMLMIHHKGKGNITSKQTGRGHSSIYDSLDLQIDLDSNNDEFKVNCAKSRDTRPFNGLVYKLIDSGEWFEKQNCHECLDFELIGENNNDSKINLCKKIQEAVRINQTSLYGLVKGDRNSFTQLLNSLISEDLVKSEIGPRNSKILSLTDNGIDFVNGDNF